MSQLGTQVPISCPDTPLMLIGRVAGVDGSYGRATADGPLPRDPRDASLWLPGQGRANSCGTTTLAYVLRYLLGEGSPSPAEIDSRVRRGNLFSAPLLLVDYARRLGLAAEAYNGASLDLVLGLVDRGVPVLVLTDTTPLKLADTAYLHWVALVAHCGEKVGVYNPHGFQEELGVASFESHWQQARIFGLPAWRRFAIAITTDHALLPRGSSDLSSVAANLAALGVAGVVNSSVGLRHGSLARAPRHAAGVLVGAGQTAGGSVLLLAGALAAGIAALLGLRHD